MSLQDVIFGKDELKPQYVNDALQGQINISSATTPEWFRTLAKKSVADLVSKNPGYVAAQEGDTGAALTNLNTAGSRVAGFDPIKVAKDWGSTQMSNIQSLIRSLTGADSAAAKMARLRLGYAGRPDSSYQQLLRSQDAAKSVMPVAESLLSRVGSDVGSMGTVSQNAIGSLVAALSSIPGAYQALAEAILRPAQAAGTVGGSDAGILQALAEAANGNFAGFEQIRKMGLMDYNNALGSLLNGVGVTGSGGSYKAGGGSGGGGGGGGLGSILGLLSAAGVF